MIDEPVTDGAVNGTPVIDDASADAPAGDQAGNGAHSHEHSRRRPHHLRHAIHGLMDDPQQERAFLSAMGFTVGFAGCRGVTHAIKHHIPPFHNFSSSGGTHIHHSTFGIFGLLGIGYLWAQQIFTGHDAPPRWGSRVTATTYGLAAALTLDEFALWLDLHDDYWDAAGRKSIDAVAIFGGLMTMTVLASEALPDVESKPTVAKFLSKLDIRRVLPNATVPASAS